jgi:hypothetical protein
MNKRRKIILLVIAAAVILPTNAYFLNRYYENYRKYGTILRPRYGRITRAGNVIVKALYAYRNEEGDFPDRLEDLVPKYIEEIPAWNQAFAPRDFTCFRFLIRYGDRWEYRHSGPDEFFLRAPLMKSNVKKGLVIEVYYKHAKDEKAWFIWDSLSGIGQSASRKLRFAGP